MVRHYLYFLDQGGFNCCLGLGKSHSREWWTALAKMLVQEGYLQEKYQDIYKIYGLSQKGAQLLGMN